MTSKSKNRIPKDVHARRAYHLRRAERFADSASDALGRLWREVGELSKAYEPASPTATDRLGAVLHAITHDWREAIDKKGWSGVHMPEELRNYRRDGVALANSARRKR